MLIENYKDKFTCIESDFIDSLKQRCQYKTSDEAVQIPEPTECEASESPESSTKESLEKGARENPENSGKDTSGENVDLMMENCVTGSNSSSEDLFEGIRGKLLSQNGNMKIGQNYCDDGDKIVKNTDNINDTNTNNNNNNNNNNSSSSNNKASNNNNNNNNNSRFMDSRAFLTLTKKRHALRKLAVERIQSCKNVVDYVFADVNCTLCMKLKNGALIHFSTENELDRILRQLA